MKIKILTGISILMVFALSGFAQNSQPDYTIHGTLNEMDPPKWVYFSDFRGWQDSVRVVDGHYEFKGATADHQMIEIRTSHRKPNMSSDTHSFRFLTDKGDINVVSTGDISSSKINGPGAHRQRELTEITDYIKHHPNIDMASSEYHHPNSIDPTTAPSASKEQLFISQQIAERKTMIGQKAMNFTQPDTNGKPVSLDSFKGKYVLIDFWSSWCIFCRIENPDLVKAYQKYKDKGFEILGVSLNSPGTKGGWLSAIKKDNLIWTQVSDLSGWSNAAARLYGVTSIPQNFLIDPNGIIVAKNLKWEELDEELAAIFK